MFCRYSTANWPGEAVRNWLGWTCLKQNVDGAGTVVPDAVEGETVLSALASAGIKCRTVWTVPLFAACRCSYPYGAKFSYRLVSRDTACLPFEGKLCFFILLCEFRGGRARSARMFTTMCHGMLLFCGSVTHTTTTGAPHTGGCANGLSKTWSLPDGWTLDASVFFSGAKVFDEVDMCGKCSR